MIAVSELARSRTAMASVAAIMPALKGGGTFAPAHRVTAPAYYAVTAGSAAKVEPDPTDDGSIIIECVALGNRMISGFGGSEQNSAWQPAGVPRWPLGPSNCWPQDQK
jgi:hypothetical protein